MLFLYSFFFFGSIYLFFFWLNISISFLWRLFTRKLGMESLAEKQNHVTHISASKVLTTDPIDNAAINCTLLLGPLPLLLFPTKHCLFVPLSSTGLQNYHVELTIYIFHPAKLFWKLHYIIYHLTSIPAYVGFLWYNQRYRIPIIYIYNRVKYFFLYL